MLGTIGGTPVVRLERLVEPDMAEVWANLTVALELAGRLGPGKLVATPLVDSGMKYLAGDPYA
jgi:cysteine synthase